MQYVSMSTKCEEADENNSSSNGKRPKLATIKIDREVYDKIDQHISNNSKGTRSEGGIRKFVNDTVKAAVDWHTIKQNMVPPFLKYIVTEDDSIFVRDTKRGERGALIEVQARFTDTGDNDCKQVGLYCVTDESTECIHVAFCLRIPELAKLDNVIKELESWRVNRANANTDPTKPKTAAAKANTEAKLSQATTASN